MLRWAVVTASLLGCVRAEPQPQPTLVVEIFGSRTAWERQDVAVLPLMAGPELKYASPYLMRRFSTSTLFESASEAMLDLASSREGQVVSHVTWHPFVCRGNTDYVDKLRDGWHPKETLQADLADDGAISVYSEFDHTLYNECECSGCPSEGTFYAPSGSRPSCPS